MKKLLIMLSIMSLCKPIAEAQCPPSASAVESIYALCPSGCGVLLQNWPEGVLVDIFGGNPVHVITNATVSGTLGGSGLGSAFVCVPCNIPLTFASIVPQSSNGCVITNTGLLPVVLNNFTASVSNGIASLKWIVSLEQGTVGYIIQRSNDGKVFTDLATIQANAIQSIQKTYSYSDVSVGQGVFYYRLKIPQANGSISYSQIEQINNQSSLGIKISPNPVVGNSFKINLPETSLPALMTISDAQGRSVYSSKVSQTSATINATLSSGVYAIKVIGNNSTSFIQKIIKK